MFLLCNPKQLCQNYNFINYWHIAHFQITITFHDFKLNSQQMPICWKRIKNDFCFIIQKLRNFGEGNRCFHGKKETWGKKPGYLVWTCINLWFLLYHIEIIIWLTIDAKKLRKVGNLQKPQTDFTGCFPRKKKIDEIEPCYRHLMEPISPIQKVWVWLSETFYSTDPLSTSFLLPQRLWWTLIT